MVPFLPSHPVISPERSVGKSSHPFGVISGAPYGSSAILPISWSYIKLMGPKGLAHATKVGLKRDCNVDIFVVFVFQGCALVTPGNPWHLTAVALGRLGNVTYIN